MGEGTVGPTFAVRSSSVAMSAALLSFPRRFGDDGSARAYECVVAIANDGSWTFDWHWMTGEPHSLVWHGPGGPVGDFLRSIVEGPTRSTIRASA